MTETFQPFPYQIPMIEHLLANDRAALFVSPGKGKTVVTLTALDTLATCGQFRGALIVAPLRVCSITWPAQVARWAHTSWMRVANLRTPEGMEAWLDGSADIYLINSELLPNRLPQMFPKKSFVPPVDTLVIDELSLAKNPQSKRFKALYKSLDKIPRRWGLTGTPIPNNYLDLFMQVKMLDDGKRLGKTFGHYKSDWFYPADYMGYTFKLKTGAKEDIDRRLADLALVMVGDSTDLPASSIIDVPVTLPTEARKQYRTLEKDLLALIDDLEVVAPSAATLCNKLLQITSGAVYDEDRRVLPVHDAKLDALRELLATHKGEPVLVLCAFRHESARILKALPQAMMFDEMLLDEWQAGRIPVWVADPRSLSHGIDGLQKSCRIAVWCSLTYSHETYVQTNARLIRTGQQAETLIYRIIAPGTIDDAVAEALRDKSDTQSGMLHAVRALQLMRGKTLPKK
jgi:superfamily II DNA or RNA helicase